MAHADYDVESGDIRLQTIWNEKQLARGIPGARWDPQHKSWKVTASWASLVIMRGLFKNDLTVGDALNKWSWDLFRLRIEPALEMRNLLEPVESDAQDLSVTRSWKEGDVPQSLYSFQEAGVLFMNRADSGLLGDEMGSG